MLLAMNWGAALLMAMGLGIVYWHATRDTGAQCSTQAAFTHVCMLLLVALRHYQKVLPMVLP